MLFLRYHPIVSPHIHTLSKSSLLGDKYLIFKFTFKRTKFLESEILSLRNVTEHYIINLFHKFLKRDCRPDSVIGFGKTHKAQYHKNAHGLVIGMQISAIGRCIDFEVEGKLMCFGRWI